MPRQIPPNIQAQQAAQMALASAPRRRDEAMAPPAGMDPAFYRAMVGAGAAPHTPAPSSRPPSALDNQVVRQPGVTLGDVRNMPIMDLIAKQHGPQPSIGAAPQVPQPAPAMPPVAAPQMGAPQPSMPPVPPMRPPVAAPSLPPPPQAPQQPGLQSPVTPAAITPLPQQAPVMSQVSPAPMAPATANINNNVTMPQQTFTPAQPRPQLPTVQAQGLAPNLGAYAPAPSMPGYGMPRLGTPFRPAPPPVPQGLPTFANFGGGVPYSTQPTAQELDASLYGGIAPGMGNGRASRNLFRSY